MFSDLSKNFRIYLLAALSNFYGERYYSAIKRVKNCLRSTIVSNRLISLALLNIENIISQNIYDSSLINNFSIIFH
jgi:hypothetical protein